MADPPARREDRRTEAPDRGCCFGNCSVQIELAIARLLNVAETFEVQHLNILAYLSAGIPCHRRPQPVARC